MEEGSRKFTKEERERVDRWLERRRAAAGPCPICKALRWDVPEEFVELRPYAGGRIEVGVGIFPHFMIICRNCGYTVLVNALVADVMEQPKEKEAEDAK